MIIILISIHIPAKKCNIFSIISEIYPPIEEIYPKFYYPYIKYFTLTKYNSITDLEIKNVYNDIIDNCHIKILNKVKDKNKNKKKIDNNNNNDKLNEVRFEEI